jgi:25S rRNA (uracil2843-N3)-methyltransferase
MARTSKIGRTARAIGTDSSHPSECHGDKLGKSTRIRRKGDAQVSMELQQRALNVFRDAFMSRMAHDFPRLLQEVKKNLFDREFAKSFEREELLETYALRWSPSRALTYMNLFCIIPQLPINTLARSANKSTAGASQSLGSNDDRTFSPLFDAKPRIVLENNQKSYQTSRENPSEAVSIACLGGGSGAELVALAGYLRWIGSTPRDSSTDDDDDPKKSVDFNITILDVADWSSIIRTLHAGVTTSPPISKFASTAVKANNAALTNVERFKVHFQQCDILDLSIDQLKHTLRDAKLVTLMFTLNELYNISIKATTNLLLSVTSILSPGALLLVVDSPGSYSTVNISKDSQEDVEAPKKYPMQWLLDHTLLESASISSRKTQEHEKQWEKLYSDESKWLRLADELTYPIELEDMRYQIHLYEKT